TWKHMEYETAPDKNPWGCYVLSNGRMIMGSDAQNHKVYYSDDDGRNWTEVQSASFNEPTFIELEGGVVMAICRENMDSSKNIQKPWMHVSNDYGTTWSDAVRMETVGYMGNNNCNAYVHDGYVELFVGCRIPTNSPQYTDTLYQIDQYVMPTEKGAVDEFEFVHTVYQYKNDSNPQGIRTNLTSADDFSTPCIAIKNKSQALLMFYAPTGRNVTHHLIAIGNVPVDEFEIPKPMPQKFSASQVFTGNNEAVTICDSAGVTYRNGYPVVGNNAYLLLNDIRNGGYLHVQTTHKADCNAWEIPILSNVRELAVLAGCGDTALPLTPMPSGAASPLVGGNMRKSGTEWYPAGEEIVDLYAQLKEDAWWLFYEDSWIRNYTSDDGIPIPADAAAAGWDNGYMVPYTVGGLTTYKAFTPARAADMIYVIEYDKA
ncbi:MAG: sialidase family protein, partial [Eubacteriales bacterium]